MQNCFLLHNQLSSSLDSKSLNKKELIWEDDRLNELNNLLQSSLQLTNVPLTQNELRTIEHTQSFNNPKVEKY